MEKEFIPYTEALALKELGFKGKCFAKYDKFINNKLDYQFTGAYPFDNFAVHLPAPTFSQAFRWFREKYNLSFYIWRKEELFKIVLQRPNQNSYFFNDEFNTYEEAELECLKKLIEIVKEK